MIAYRRKRLRKTLLEKAQGLNKPDKSAVHHVVLTRIDQGNKGFAVDRRLFLMELERVYSIWPCATSASWHMMDGQQRELFTAKSLLRGVDVRVGHAGTGIQLGCARIEHMVSHPMMIRKELRDEWDARDLTNLIPEEEEFRCALLRALAL